MNVLQVEAFDICELTKCICRDGHAMEWGCFVIKGVTKLLQIIVQMESIRYNLVSLRKTANSLVTH